MKCYSCLYFRWKENACVNVCVYNRINNNGLAEDIPKDKGKFCKRYEAK